MLSSRRFWIGLCLALVVLGGIAYGPSLTNAFVAWDDLDLVVDNPVVRHLTPSTVARAFSTYDPELYIPLTFVSYQIDHLLGGGGPLLFHVTNLLLHVINAFLVAWFVWLLTKNRWFAAIASLLFLLHPLNVEAVAWVSGRKDLLSALFFLLSCIAYMTYVRTNRTSLLRWSLLAFLCALLSKVSVAPLPILLFLIDAWERRPWNPATIKEKIPFIVLAIVFVVVALFGKERIVAAAHLSTTLLMMPKAAMFLLGKIFFPFHLSVLYPYTGAIALSSPGILWPAVALPLLLAYARVYRKRIPGLWLGLLWFLVALSPNIVNFNKGDDLRDIYITSDRYGYLPSIGVFLAVGSLVLFVLEKKPWLRDAQKRAAALSALALVLLLLLLRTRTQAFTWRDTHALFRQALDAYPNAQTAHVFMGAAYLEKGDFQRAAEEYVTAIRIRPTSRAYYNLGVVLMKTGKYDNAIAAYREALTLDPTASLAQMNIGVVYVKQQKYAEALVEFQKTVEIDPKAAAAYVNIGIMQEQLGRIAEARQAYARALAIQPDLVIAREKLDALPR